jgi:hypothetical protein
MVAWDRVTRADVMPAIEEYDLHRPGEGTTSQANLFVMNEVLLEVQKDSYS